MPRDTSRPPTKPYSIGIIVSGGTASDVYVNFRNGKTGDYKKVKTESDEASITLNELSNDGTNTGTHTPAQNKDVIEITISGRRRGGINHTVDFSKGGGTHRVTLTDVSTTNAPAISIG